MATLQSLSSEVVIILAGIAVLILLWLVLRFGRAIALGILVLGILAVAMLVTAPCLPRRQQTARRPGRPWKRLGWRGPRASVNRCRR